MNHPTNELLAGLVRRTTAKIVEYGCYDEKTGWKCPLYDEMLDCDGRVEVCCEEVRNCFEDLVEKGDVIFKENGKAKVRHGYTRLGGEVYIGRSNRPYDSYGENDDVNMIITVLERRPD